MTIWNRTGVFSLMLVMHGFSVSASHCCVNACVAICKDHTFFGPDPKTQSTKNLIFILFSLYNINCINTKTYINHQFIMQPSWRRRHYFRRGLTRSSNKHEYELASSGPFGPFLARSGSLRGQYILGKDNTFPAKPDII